MNCNVDGGFMLRSEKRNSRKKCVTIINEKISHSQLKYKTKGHKYAKYDKT